MLKVNLRPYLEVLHPYSQVPFGRVIATNRDVVRRRLLTASLNHALSFLRGRNPAVFNDAHFSFQLGKMVSPEGVGRLKSGQDLLPEDFKLEYGHFGMERAVSALNTGCQHAGENRLEFYLQDMGGLPRSVIRIRELAEPFDNEAELKLARHDPVSVWFLLAPRLKKSKIFTEREIYRMVVEKFGQVRHETVANILAPTYHKLIRQVMRPQRCDSQRLYYFWGSGFRPLSHGSVPVILPGKKTRTIALSSEVGEIVAEGRLIRVESGKKERPAYFTPLALKKWMERGAVVELEGERGKRYVVTSTLKEYLAGSNFPPVPKPTASAVWLKYLKEKAFSPEDQKAYPFLAQAIEILRIDPAGAERGLEAARQAAEYGISEEGLVALLLKDKRLEFGDFMDDEYATFPFYLFRQLKGYGVTLVECIEKTRQVERWIRHVHNALGLDLNWFRIRSSEDVRVYLQLLLNQLKVRGKSDQREAYLLFFCTILADLKLMAPRRLKEQELKNLRVAIAPLAERCGFLGLAAEIRNEIFRIAYGREYQKLKGQIEKGIGLTYAEMELHLQDTTELLREGLIAAGLKPEDFKITYRVKLPYSVWEKMQSQGIEDPCRVKDLFGINLVVRDDAQAYLVADLIQMVLPELSLSNFEDKHDLLGLLKGTRRPMYRDQIAHPKRSGFSAITLMRLTELKLPVEVQITSRPRDENNREGKAVHWQYKVNREVRGLYGIKGKVKTLLDFDEDLGVVLYGDWQGDYRRTFKKGLAYRKFEDLTEDKAAEFLGYGPEDELHYYMYWEIPELKKARRLKWRLLRRKPETENTIHVMPGLSLVLRA